MHQLLMHMSKAPTAWTFDFINFLVLSTKVALNELKKHIMIEIQNLLIFVLPRWIVYTHWSPEALDVRDVECRAIRAHQLYTDTVGAMETLVSLSRPVVIPMCKYTLLY